MVKVGIFVKNHDSIFTNGCIQQGYFLLKSFRKLGYQANFITIEPNYTMFEYINEPIENVLSLQKLVQYDLVVFGSLIVHDVELLNYLRFLDIRVANLMVGNYYVINMEEFVFGVHGGVFKTMMNEYIDEVWLMPMYTHAKEYIASISKKPVRICPYVWDSDIIQAYKKHKNFTLTYTPYMDTRPIEIIIMEPNLSIHKTSLVPLLIANEFYKQHPDKMGTVHVFSKPSKNDTYLEMIKGLEIIQSKKIAWYGRIATLDILDSIYQQKSKFVIVSSNIRNGLNFLHLECFYYGVPIIHNCEPFKDNGLYYHDDDQAVEIMKARDLVYEVWKNPSVHNRRGEISVQVQYNPVSSHNVQGYKELTENLLKEPRRTGIDLLPKLSAVYKTVAANTASKVDDLSGLRDVPFGVVCLVQTTTSLDVFTHTMKSIPDGSVPIHCFVEETRKDDWLAWLVSWRESLPEDSPHANRITYEWVSGSDNRLATAYPKLFCYSRSPFVKTVVVEHNSILLLNLSQLVSQCKEESIIGLHSAFNVDEEKVKKLVNYINIFKTTMNIKAELKPILYDSGLWIGNSIRLKRGLRMIFDILASEPRFMKLLDEDELTYLSLILTQTGVNVVHTGLHMIGCVHNQWETTRYRNMGRAITIQDTIIQIVLDEDPTMDFNSMVFANNIRRIPLSPSKYTYSFDRIKMVQFKPHNEFLQDNTMSPSATTTTMAPTSIPIPFSSISEPTKTTNTNNNTNNTKHNKKKNKGKQTQTITPPNQPFVNVGNSVLDIQHKMNLPNELSASVN